MWESRETVLCFPRSPSGRHFHALSSGDFNSLQRLAVQDRELCVAIDDMQELNCFGIVWLIAEAKDAFAAWFERNATDHQ